MTTLSPVPNLISEEDTSGNYETVSQFSNWTKENWKVIQIGLIVIAGWLIAEIISKKGLA